MQVAKGFLPYEPGDTIELESSPGLYIIEDIRMIQYISNPRVEFEVLIAGKTSASEKRWVSSTQIKRRIV